MNQWWKMIIKRYSHCFEPIIARYKHNHNSALQGGKDAQHALNGRSISTKVLLLMGLFCGKRLITIRHPMGLCRPVLSSGVSL